MQATSTTACSRRMWDWYVTKYAPKQLGCLLRWCVLWKVLQTGQQRVGVNVSVSTRHVRAYGQGGCVVHGQGGHVVPVRPLVLVRPLVRSKEPGILLVGFHVISQRNPAFLPPSHPARIARSAARARTTSGMGTRKAAQEHQPRSTSQNHSKHALLGAQRGYPKNREHGDGRPELVTILQLERRAHVNAFDVGSALLVPALAGDAGLRPAPQHTRVVGWNSPPC